MAILWKAHTRLGLLSFFLLAISLFLLAPSFRSQSDAPLYTRDILQNLKNDLSLVNVSTTDSTCKKGVQCKKNACCGGFFGGDEGTCGFGPDFCGDDCDSQCDAKAECGKYADPANKKCPLNVCCSSYGYCGTTTEFCGSDCQSNCDLKPAVPSGGSPIDVISNKVIGYYQSWADRRSCHVFPPDAIPVDGLTHLNFAFAYIDINTFEITSMDANTPEALFARTTDIKNTKSRNGDLEVFVSLGGWTFSDNDTLTQPLFSTIAADEEKRQTFADNLVQFMVRYGFDGVDLDWEYPGASDRGGNPNDTKNYVKLLKTLRSTFDSSARGSYGLTFTIPTSYWYLRWFDVVGLLKYADWVNLMSYDLHGVWDEHNPIGSKVHPHTNLTEIKTTSELLWRNNIPPSKLVLGIGFYGRSFHLKDTDCNTPGCAFEGDAQKGDCTKSSGTLAYFEIMDIIKDQDIKVTHDKEAAVNYITYGDDKDQWVSYDSNETFQQKVDWANEVGMGGVMIWSVDQDDNAFTALQALIGKPLPAYKSSKKRSTAVDATHWKSLNGEGCKISDCIASGSDAPSGYGLAPSGKFSDKCSGGKFKFVWCPLSKMPSKCTWRGSGSCHGQCHESEVTLAHSPHGSKKCASPGQQAFCCESNTWAKLGADKCGWSDTCETCPNDRPYGVSSKKVGFFSKCNIPWCCPYDFQGCHWVGKGTCDDNECSATDVQVGLDPSGNTGSKCANGFSNRKKPLCCNAPKNSNAFLPAPLKNLFPTLPPKEDVPSWEKQNIDDSAGEDPEAFFFVLIDGPADAVTNVNKRDGSHIEFVTGGVHHGQAAQTAHFVCLDDSVESNCDDMHTHGLEGKVLRMPDNLGFAKHVVAHSVTVSNYTVPQERLSKRAPEGSPVYELTYSYNFSKVKRDTSKPIYLRVDYADSKDYWSDIVEAAPKSKRDLEPRFWSKTLSVWKSKLKKLRTRNKYPLNGPGLSALQFDVPLYESAGSSQGCDNSGWLKVGLKGTMQSSFTFGYTLIGTLQPFKLDEAYGFFDSAPWIKANLNFDGKGILDINHGRGAVRDLFSSPVTAFEASHPGIISFSPQFNAEISMVGSGEIDANFSAYFDGGAATLLRTHAPPTLGDFSGSARPSTTIRDAVTGHISVGDDAPSTLFGLNVNLETALEMKIYDYGRSSVNTGARFAARTPRTVRVVSDTGSGDPGILVSPQVATADVVPLGNEVVADWYDEKTYPIGEHFPQLTIFTGGDKPPDRKEPEMSDSPIFTEKNFMACTDIEWSGDFTCDYDLGSVDPDLSEPSPPYRKRAGYLDDDSHPLEPRAGGPSGGGTERYPVYEAPEPANRPANWFYFETPTYPNGDNGRHLNDARGFDDAYGPANPRDCQDPSVTSQGVQGVNYGTVQSEHPNDRSVIPNHFLNFVQTGRLDISTGQDHVTSLPTFTFDELSDYFSNDYRHWAPAGMNNVPAGSASADVADAMGSTSNPNVMTNLETALNRLKGQMYTTESSGPGDSTWNNWNRNPSQANSEASFMALRGMFSVFHYMQAIRQQRDEVFEGVIAALQTFDQVFGAAHPGDSRRMTPLMQEFQPQWEARVINFHTANIRTRLNDMQRVYSPLERSPNRQEAAMAKKAMKSIRQYQARLQKELHF